MSYSHWAGWQFRKLWWSLLEADTGGLGEIGLDQFLIILSLSHDRNDYQLGKIAMHQHLILGKSNTVILVGYVNSNIVILVEKLKHSVISWKCQWFGVTKPRETIKERSERLRQF